MTEQPARYAVQDGLTARQLREQLEAFDPDTLLDAVMAVDITIDRCLELLANQVDDPTSRLADAVRDMRADLENVLARLEDRAAHAASLLEMVQDNDHERARDQEPEDPALLESLRRVYRERTSQP
jgi:hypothetical protein